jgi:hypothetical protein
MSTQTHSHAPVASGYSDDQRREGAGDYTPQLRASQVHEVVFAAGIVVMFVVNLVTKGAGAVAGEWSWWFGWAW